MPGRTIGITLATAGLLTAVSGSGVVPPTEAPTPAPADTVEADPLAPVSMEPIRVVISAAQRLEAVTMEPIRVVIPREEEPEARPEP